MKNMFIIETKLGFLSPNLNLSNCIFSQTNTFKPTHYPNYDIIQKSGFIIFWLWFNLAKTNKPISIRFCKQFPTYQGVTYAYFLFDIFFHTKMVALQGIQYILFEHFCKITLVHLNSHGNGTHINTVYYEQLW